MSTTTKVQIDTKTFIRFWLVIIGFIAAGYLLYKASFGLSIIFAALFQLFLENEQDTPDIKTNKNKTI